jgi:hypothetical protein
MGNKPIKMRPNLKFSKSEKKISMKSAELKTKIKSLNAITQSDEFRKKTGYIILFTFNESTYDKFINLITVDKYIKANLVRSFLSYHLPLQ